MISPNGCAMAQQCVVDKVLFNRPDFSHRELQYLRECLGGGDLAGDGSFTGRCRSWLEGQLGATVLLTHSCTAALEMAAMLTVKAGDEVIMPSFTFVSTANAFVLRGATPVFIDIRPDTLNIDENLIEAAVTERTRAIVPVHYAGVSCAMEPIMAIATKNGVAVVEDAAQGYLAHWKGRPLGTMGSLGTLSFHQSKNIVSGEGGALILNDSAFEGRAHILREKGTNRTEFFRGKVDKYEWLDIGSSYLPSDLIAAVLLAQLEVANEITAERLRLWARYHQGLSEAERSGVLRRPVTPEEAHHNGHIYYLVFESNKLREQARLALLKIGIEAYTHYVPLHSAPAGRRYGRVAGQMTVTDRVAATMLRLPIHGSMTEEHIDKVINAVTQVWRASARTYA
ncbi:MAG: DegT/DnrJ/EryC1/StrS family aminotransferase protein [Microvirga sp.]|jgi:dTDP-4-amino-4,6-dideoxygalactose transaminase|nr:DegT/DnrJ/EryC1/StrS family aminotransferase protein [Microvirga sp.]